MVSGVFSFLLYLVKNLVFLLILEVIMVSESFVSWYILLKICFFLMLEVIMESGVFSFFLYLVKDLIFFLGGYCSHFSA